jgi:hypothetical protein
MRFEDGIDDRYGSMLLDAVETIRRIGNSGHRETVDALESGACSIRVVPLDEIGCSGVTGLIDRHATNRRIAKQKVDMIDALAEVHITFSDWTFDIAGSRGVEGTLVHEGLHACDFARIIASFSEARDDPGALFDLSLYDLEHRAAHASAEYLVLAGKEDYLDEGRKLRLVGIDTYGRPFVDHEGIEARMRNDYKIGPQDHGGMMSKRLGLRTGGRIKNVLSYFGV